MSLQESLHNLHDPSPASIFGRRLRLAKMRTDHFKPKPLLPFLGPADDADSDLDLEKLFAAGALADVFSWARVSEESDPVKQLPDHQRPSFAHKMDGNGNMSVSKKLEKGNEAQETRLRSPQRLRLRRKVSSRVGRATRKDSDAPLRRARSTDVGTKRHGTPTRRAHTVEVAVRKHSPVRHNSNNAPRMRRTRSADVETKRHRAPLRRAHTDETAVRKHSPVRPNQVNGEADAPLRRTRTCTRSSDIGTKRHSSPTRCAHTAEMVVRKHSHLHHIPNNAPRMCRTRSADVGTKHHRAPLRRAHTDEMVASKKPATRRHQSPVKTDTAQPQRSRPSSSGRSPRRCRRSNTDEDSATAK
ncbi:expressed unknown protein [Seminavis robusta]|uniref:Uncharacterized protein n=1 Tax=Seminavis robusta TaxID=568900 RepID=A0A9N8DDD2_9STRA|nr:expressed unknown protein [Seminavis robusta]|eukprot:Sro90_g047400.1 n/a (357) ;mRNA; f:73031-74101